MHIIFDWAWWMFVVDNRRDPPNRNACGGSSKRVNNIASRNKKKISGGMGIITTSVRTNPPPTPCGCHQNIYKRGRSGLLLGEEDANQMAMIYWGLIRAAMIRSCYVKTKPSWIALGSELLIKSNSNSDSRLVGRSMIRT